VSSVVIDFKPITTEDTEDHREVLPIMVHSSKVKAQRLFGLRVLVGRARHQASALSAGLRKLGAQVVEIPFIEIHPPKSYAPLDAALRNLAACDWLILTSVNGVEALWARLQKLRLRTQDLRHLRIAAIGPATKKAIVDRGLKVHLVPEKYVAESVVAGLRGKVKGKRVLLARAKVARDVIPRELRKVAARVDVVEAYETVIPRNSRAKLRSLLKDPKRHPNVITFTSSSSVRNFVALLDKDKAMWRGRSRPRTPQGTAFASIGPVTSATLRELGLPVDIEARHYTIPGLIEAIADFR
jgi:uroporphyrinogen-III synthase